MSKIGIFIANFMNTAKLCQNILLRSTTSLHYPLSGFDFTASESDT